MRIFFALFLCMFAFAAFAETGAAQPIKAFELTYNDAEDAIGWVLMQKGVGDKVAASITGHKTGALFSHSKPISVDIRGLQFDKQNSRWSASLLFVSDGEVVSALPASGKFEEMVELPVLKRPFKNGDVIANSDLEIRDFPMDHTRTDTVTDMASLIGKSPLRSISPYRPIRGNEIAAPTLIKKNTLVQMHYNSPGMEITTAGQTMADGAKGDVISVRNVTSKKIVQAVIATDGSVTVLSPGTQTSQLSGAQYAAN